MTSSNDTVLARYMNGLVICSWLSLVLVFAAGPLWLILSGHWFAIWDHMEWPAPKMTDYYLSTWKRGFLAVPVMVAAMICAMHMIYRTSRSPRLSWLVRAVSVIPPLAGIGLIVAAVHFVPRRHLAQTMMELEQLPRYDQFETYVATARDESRTVEQRRQALLSIGMMRVLEMYRISPPADPRRDSSRDIVDVYLDICGDAAISMEVRSDAAWLLKNHYIRGYVGEYPSGASIDKSAAQDRVALIFLQVVQHGGFGRLTHLLDWPVPFWYHAEDAFEGISVSDEVVIQLVACLTATDVAVRAEAAAALGSIGSTAEDARVLASLETLTLDPDERVRELAAQVIRKISREETPGDAPR